MTRVVIGLGANLGQPARQLRQALGQLAMDPSLSQLRCSAFVRSAALLPPAQRPVQATSQPDFCNAVAVAQLHVEPAFLLSRLKAIEASMGRDPSAPRWSARALDLDILDVEGSVRLTPELRLPHPEIGQRLFVLQPWLSLEPQATLADGTRLAERLQALDAPPLRLWDDARGGHSVS